MEMAQAGDEMQIDKMVINFGQEMAGNTLHIGLILTYRDIEIRTVFNIGKLFKKNFNRPRKFVFIDINWSCLAA